MKMSAHSSYHTALGKMIMILVLVSSVLTSEASGATYYLSPTGSDSNFGTSSTSPWKTFSFATPKLKPGDTLILRDGTYDGSNSGYPSISCGSNATSGTASQPITVKAENERHAWISGTGANQDVLKINGCSYWVIQGLHISDADNVATTTNRFAVDAANSSNLTFRRLLLDHNNRYSNSHLLILDRTNNSLVEESEFYYFHRHGGIASYSNNNTFRRNYCNSRGYADVAGGYPSGNSTRADTCISLYPASSNIVENNISEGSDTFVDVNASAQADDNQILGNISLNDTYGSTMTARGNTDALMPHNNMAKDFVVITPEQVGFYPRSTKGTRCDNCTFIGGNNGFFADRNGNSSYWGDGNYSVYSTNTLSINNASRGFFIESTIQTWATNHPNAYNNGTNYSPSSSANLISAMTMNPSLGACKVYIPDNSPLKGKGQNGADIGANVLYRYENGVLTTQPLWDPVTGQFPCGATVAGLNGIAGSSCFDVYTRLNVNTNGCSFPSSYVSQPPLTSPTNLKIGSQ